MIRIKTGRSRGNYAVGDHDITVQNITAVGTLIGWTIRSFPSVRRSVAVDRRGLPIQLPDHENRNRTANKHLGGLAAEQKTAQPAPAVRGHDDEIAVSLSGGCDNRLGRL